MIRGVNKMKKIRLTLAIFAMLACVCSRATAADLLDVKPVVTDNSVSVEISADIPMTYTFYNIPGQPRAVVDIADADPEKVEPLIVVNKGILSSISVDKAQIAGMVVSRIIFNLVSQSEIAVAATADRKILTVTFATASKTAPPPPIADTKPESKTVSPSEQPVPAKQESTVAPDKPGAAPLPTGADVTTEDPLGLDEPTKPQTTEPASAKKNIPAIAAHSKLPAAAIATKAEPALPAVQGASSIIIKSIITGDNFIDIQTSGAVGGYKVIRLTQPERIAVDIPSVKSSLETRTVWINKFGITKARVGVNPTHIRIVLDSALEVFPKHSITHSKNGLRINFN